MFEEKIVESTRGIQGSKWDQYYDKFDKPGKALYAKESDMSRPQAAQFSARMNKLEEARGGKRKFHSGYDAVEGKTFVRVRPEGEVPSDSEEQSED